MKKEKITIATMGPKGTFSDIAAQVYIKKKRIKAGINLYPTIYDVFEAVNFGKADLGVVPLENSEDGSVRITLDELFKSDLNIESSMVLPIKHCLAVYSRTKVIREIMSNTHPLTQCHNFIKKYYPNAKLSESLSTASAMQKIARGKKIGVAAIGPSQTAKLYDLKILKDNIQDNKKNITRFVIVSPLKSNEGSFTSIALYGHKDRPGLLYDLLGIFAKRKINLTRIESRPAKSKLGVYVFYIDFEGSLLSLEIQTVLKEIKRQGFKIKIFGSFSEIK